MTLDLTAVDGSNENFLFVPASTEPA